MIFLTVGAVRPHYTHFGIIVAILYPIKWQVRDMLNKDGLQEEQLADIKAIRNERDKDLALKARAGDTQAREALILEHLDLIDKMLGPFVAKGVPTDVLYQEGCYGLIQAVDRFDPNNSASLDTYASYYVKKYLCRAMQENFSHPIILKQKSSNMSRRYRETNAQLTEKLGREPTNQEIADEMGISYKAAASLLFSTIPAFSLDNMAPSERLSESSLGRGVEATVLDNLNEMCLDEFPVTLSPTEEKILRLRFGFGPGGKPHTFAQIGKQFNVSADTISDYYTKAIQKLRDAKSSK